MKRKTRRLLGSVGLVAVGAITVFAAFLPAPETQATGMMTDVIQIRVVPSHPEITISGITSGSTVTTPEHMITVDYSGAETLEITMHYTDLDGRSFVKTLDSLEDLDYETGQRVYTIDLEDMLDDDDEPFGGYGNYRIEAKGFGAEGSNDEDIISFKYAEEEIPIPNTGTPDTGKMTGVLNISKADYLITGMIIFGIAATSSVVFLAKELKKNSK